MGGPRPSQLELEPEDGRPSAVLPVLHEAVDWLGEGVFAAQLGENATLPRQAVQPIPQAFVKAMQTMSPNHIRCM